LLPAMLRVRRDHVIAEMAEHLGAHVTETQAPFDPEGGAYSTPSHYHASHQYDS
jgi:urease accessory protein